MSNSFFMGIIAHIVYLFRGRAGKFSAFFQSAADVISPAPIQCKSKEILYTSLKHPKPLHQQYNPDTQQHLEEPPHHNPRRQPTDEPLRLQVGASCCHLTALLAAQGLRDGEPDRLSRELRELIPSRRPKLPQHPQIILKQQPDSSGSMPAVAHDVGVSHTAAYDFEQA